MAEDVIAFASQDVKRAVHAGSITAELHCGQWELTGHDDVRFSFCGHLQRRTVFGDRATPWRVCPAQFRINESPILLPISQFQVSSFKFPLFHHSNTRPFRIIWAGKSRIPNACSFCYSARDMDNWDIIVIGGGPAGMMAAIAAGQAGRRVLMFERQSKPGLKLLASGGGRCNLTNTLSREEFTAAFGRNGRFMEPALRAMDSKALREWLAQRGVQTFSPDGFHVYPVAQQSRAVLQALLDACREAGVEWRYGEAVTRLLVNNGWVTGVRTAAGEEYSARAVVLAAGGMTYPQLSGTRAGYEAALQAGHLITALYPVLVGLVVRENWPRRCAGAGLDDAEVWIAGRAQYRIRGAVLFTHEGLSGPAVLDLSREVVPQLETQGPVELKLRVRAEDSADAWRFRFHEWRMKRGAKTVRALLDGWLPPSVARAMVEEAGLDSGATVSHMTKEQQTQLASLLAGATLTVVGHGGEERAMITRGGVDLKQVDPRTLQSRVVQGLFLAGELLDLDGPCGGFNLQWAFSSGRLAGTSAASLALSH